MPGFFFPAKTAGEIAVCFYQVLPGYSVVFWQDIRRDLKYCEMRDFNMAESFVCLFDFILYIQSTIFQLNRDGSSWVEPVLS